MPEKKKSDKIAQKKNNYQVIKDSKDNGPDKVPTYACDRKRCLNGRCGSCWMVIFGMSIAVGIFIIMYITGVLGFTFSTTGTETLSEAISGDTLEPTLSPTLEPTEDPTLIPSSDPTVLPTDSPSPMPTVVPSAAPSEKPTFLPTETPTTSEPTMTPSASPTELPTDDPTSDPTGNPTTAPTKLPTIEPTHNPTGNPTTAPTKLPTVEPTHNPTADPTTSEPTSDPTSNPTSERRRRFHTDMNSNVLFLIADGNLFNYTEFETPAVDKFLTEGYTLDKVQQGSVVGRLISGNIFRSGSAHNQGMSSWAKLLGGKGYTNYYYGSRMDDSEEKVATQARQGWNFFDEDVIMEKVQTRIKTIKDEKWFIAVNWTISPEDIGLMVNGSKTTIDRCSRYLKVAGTELNHQMGLRCQCTVGYDAIFGRVIETLESTGQWMKTIVVFMVAGPQMNFFSVGGGALHANFLNKKNRPSSMLDVARTILEVSGFSDWEIRNLIQYDSPVIRMMQ